MLLLRVAIVAWNAFLTARGTYIKLAWVPAWSWSVLFIVARLPAAGIGDYTSPTMKDDPAPRPASPLERFDASAKRLVRVSKAELDQREAA